MSNKTLAVQTVLTKPLYINSAVVKGFRLARPLSPRQREILGLLVENGMTQSQIARRLDCSRSSVKNHLLKIKSKLGVETLYQAVAVAMSEGLVGVPERNESGNG